MPPGGGEGGGGGGPRESPLSMHSASPQAFGPHGSRSSPLSGPKGGEEGGGSAVAGDGDSAAAPAQGAESNGWSGGRRQRAPVITDRLISLKAEFLELHDMLMESDFQWEESQRFCEVLKLQLDQLMLVPHRHRDSLAPPI